jgi:hypothetical protein
MFGRTADQEIAAPGEGPANDIVPAEVPHAPNSREAMADLMLRIPSREKFTPFACAWNAKAPSKAAIRFL